MTQENQDRNPQEPQQLPIFIGMKMEHNAPWEITPEVDQQTAQQLVEVYQATGDVTVINGRVKTIYTPAVIAVFAMEYAHAYQPQQQAAVVVTSEVGEASDVKDKTDARHDNETAG